MRNDGYVIPILNSAIGSLYRVGVGYVHEGTVVNHDSP